MEKKIAPRTKKAQQNPSPPRRRSADRQPEAQFEPPPWPPDGRYVTPRARESDSARSAHSGSGGLPPSLACPRVRFHDCAAHVRLTLGSP